MNKESPLVATRAALYLRVSTARQAEHDVSIPDPVSYTHLTLPTICSV